MQRSESENTSTRSEGGSTTSSRNLASQLPRKPWSDLRQETDFLARYDAVARVQHPDVATHPDHALAKNLYPSGCSAILSFELKGGREAGRKFIEKLSLFSHLANIGDAKSLVIHPASTTHFRMDDDALAAAGMGPGTIRLSIGLEHPDDLIDDLGRALHASQR